MPTDLAAYRRFFAEDIQMIANLRTPALIEALATVPRERFLGPGPWMVRGEADFQGPLRHTPGDDPRFVCHNIAVAIDPARMLFNGAPGIIASAIDALALKPGDRVLHVGTGTGYFTALLAGIVGANGRVLGVEVDEALAARATANLADMPWVEVRRDDGRAPIEGPFNAVLVNAGVTHPEPNWLDALAPGGRMMLPLTASLAAPGPLVVPGGAMGNISKGLMVLLTGSGEAPAFSARLVTFVAIYSAIGLRDDAINAALGQAMGRMPFPQLRRFRLDPHDADASCWCHTPRGCWSTSE
jgi:protein-L-isoaspartate(D-aspartate) O-methyltransferase